MKTLLRSLSVLFLLASLPADVSAQNCPTSPMGTVQPNTMINFYSIRGDAYTTGDCVGARSETWFYGFSNFVCYHGSKSSEPRCFSTNLSGTAVSDARLYACGSISARAQLYQKMPIGSDVWVESDIVSDGPRTISCPPPPPQEGYQGCWNGWEYDAEMQEYFCISPILIGLKKTTPYRLTSVDEGVLFDIDADGDLDRVAWTHAKDDLAWLAIDRNGNGTIDDGRELFGSATYTGVAANGFDALIRMQHLESGRIRELVDADDAFFGRLLLWIDANHDGISQAKELEPLSKTFASIMLGYFPNFDGQDYRDQHGNLFAYYGFANLRTGPGANRIDEKNRDLKDRQIKIFDVYVQRRPQ